MIFFRSLKIYSGANLLVRGLTYDIAQVQLISFFKRKANSKFELRKCKGHEKRDRILVSKVEFIFQISQRN